LEENGNQPFFFEENRQWRKTVSRFWRKMELPEIGSLYGLQDKRYFPVRQVFVQNRSRAGPFTTLE